MWSGEDGEIIAKVVTNSASHNTIIGLKGNEAYLAGLHSPLLVVTSTQTHEIQRTVGPFSSSIRPFTANGRQTLCFVNVNDLLGFEVGDIKSGRKRYRVEVAGHEKGPTKRHGCPSHGIGLTPDETELWLTDAHNSRLHIFDATVMSPRRSRASFSRISPAGSLFRSTASSPTLQQATSSMSKPARS